MSENQPEIDEKELEQVAGSEGSRKVVQESEAAPTAGKKNVDERKRAGTGSLRGFA